MIFSALVLGCILAPLITAFNSQQDFVFDLDTGESSINPSQIKPEGLRFLRSINFDEFFEEDGLTGSHSAPQHVRVRPANKRRDENPFEDFVHNYQLEDMFSEAASQLYEVPYEDEFFASPSDQYDSNHDRYSASSSNQYPDFGHHNGFFNDPYNFFGSKGDKKEHKETGESRQEPNYGPESSFGPEPNYGPEPTEKEKKSTEKCVESKKNGMTCQVCKDDYGGFSEHCSHSRHSGNDKKYASQRNAKDGEYNPKHRSKSNQGNKHRSSPTIAHKQTSPHVNSNRGESYPQHDSQSNRDHYQHENEDTRYNPDQHYQYPQSSRGQFSAPNSEDSHSRQYSNQPSYHGNTNKDNQYRNTPRTYVPEAKPEPKQNNVYQESLHNGEVVRNYPEESSKKHQSQSFPDVESYFPEHLNNYQQEGNKHLTYDVHVAAAPREFLEKHPKYQAVHSTQPLHTVAPHESQVPQAPPKHDTNKTPTYTIKPLYAPKKYTESGKSLPSTRHSFNVENKRRPYNSATNNKKQVKSKGKQIPNVHQAKRAHSPVAASAPTKQPEASNYGTDYVYDGFNDAASDSRGANSDNVKYNPIDPMSNFKDLSKLVNDFEKKNRKNCKKVMKESMTCYICATKDGTLDEDCMYEQADPKKGIHLMYTEEINY